MIVLRNKEFARKDYESLKCEKSIEELKKGRSDIAKDLLKERELIRGEEENFRKYGNNSRRIYIDAAINKANHDAGLLKTQIAANDNFRYEKKREANKTKQRELNKENTKKALKRLRRIKGKKLLKRGGVALLGLSALGGGNYLYKKKQKNFSKSDNTKDNSKKIGLGLSGTGAITLAKLDKSKLNGRVNLYHGSSRDGGRKILKEGLKGSHALDSENLTNTCLGGAGKKDGRKLVYTAKKKSIAKGMSTRHIDLGDGKLGRTLEMSIPYDEYKKMKRVYDNPEFEGAKNYKEYFRNNLKKGEFDNKLIDKLSAKIYWDSYSGAKGTKGTRIFEQDIDPSRIKGSKKYVKNSLKEWAKYVKNNPKRFGKEATKAAVGVGLLSAGVSKLKKSKKDDNTKK